MLFVFRIFPLLMFIVLALILLPYSTTLALASNISVHVTGFPEDFKHIGVEGNVGRLESINNQTLSTVLIQVFSPNGTLFTAENTTVDLNTLFYSKTINLTLDHTDTGGCVPLGEYRVVVSYGAGQKTETQFVFGPCTNMLSPMRLPPDHNYTLTINNQNYTIGASFQGRQATLENITANTASKTISFTISSNQTNEIGFFDMLLPRQLIDSNDSSVISSCSYMINNTSHTTSAQTCRHDTDYRISLTQFNEKDEPVNTTSIAPNVNGHFDYRWLIVSYPAGKVRIDIQGTYMVSEFGLTNLMFGISIIAGAISMVVLRKAQRLYY